jgi:hypothetical protein
MAIIVVSPGKKNKRIKTVSEWRLRGWQPKGRGLGGLYVAKNGRWWGHVDIVSKGVFKFYIHQPPDTLKSHPKWGCFRYIGNGWHAINFPYGAKSIDEGILKVELLINESFENGF